MSANDRRMVTRANPSRDQTQEEAAWSVHGGDFFMTRFPQQARGPHVAGSGSGVPSPMLQRFMAEPPQQETRSNRRHNDRDAYDRTSPAPSAEGEQWKWREHQPRHRRYPDQPTTAPFMWTIAQAALGKHPCYVILLGLISLSAAIGALGHLASLGYLYSPDWKPALCTVRDAAPQPTKIHGTERCEHHSCSYYMVKPGWTVEVEMLEPFPSFEEKYVHNPTPWTALALTHVEEGVKHARHGFVGPGVCAGEVCALPSLELRAVSWASVPPLACVLICVLHGASASHARMRVQTRREGTLEQRERPTGGVAWLCHQDTA